MAEVVISIPDILFQAAENARLGSRTKLTRSQYFCLALNEYVSRQPEREKNLRGLEEFFAQKKEWDSEDWGVQASLQPLADFPWDEGPER